ncbi:OmpA family protein [Parvicella tangerina]|uniref:Peptidoglycan-associated lipoprotein n=1 Tax=Parvicella tangerina TaxID=2829795 RepID=A0A916JLG7_9FLAO|nr:OmpA family protein [Parvicella tangerina]CAG5078946.1 Peptidoglycan-associated lipoprotein [Parvicella tangerina]
MRSFYLLTVFLFGALLAGFAQEEEEVDPNCVPPTGKKAEKLWEKANDYQKYDYKERMTALNELLEMNEDCAPCMWQKAEETFRRAQMNGNSYEIPKKYYLMLEQTCPDYHADIYYQLGLIYYSEQQDCEALNYFKKFLDFKTDDDSKLSRNYDKQLKDVEEVLEEVDFYCNFYTTNKVNFNPVLVKNVSTAGRDEYLPIISPDNELIFYTQEYEYKAKGDMMTQTIQKFCEASRPSATAPFSEGKPMPEPFNVGPKYGGATISLDNKEMYVCACAKEANYWNCDIYMTKYDIKEVKGKKKYIWSDLVNIGPNVNGTKTWEAQPSLSADGKTLYFASARQGGYGNIDLYYSERDEDGNWGLAQNMGPVINSAGSDKSPFLHCDSRTLYFVSETSLERLGAGGFDIFYSKQDPNTGDWSEPKNIGYPINTAGDEEALIVSTDGNYGYFSSDQTKGGIGKKDIFYFYMPQHARPDKVVLMKGKINTDNIAEVKDAKLEVRFEDGTTTKQEIKVQDDGEYVAVANIGDGKQDALLEVKKKGKSYESKLITKESSNETFIKDQELEVKSIKKGSTFTIDDILYKTNSSELDKASLLVLNGFANWLKENPDVKIEIQGHTDDLGADADNLALSQDRAFTVMEYLSTQGIPASRMKFKGYGETAPKVPNTSDANRAKNRRTDFKIL